MARAAGVDITAALNKWEADTPNSMYAASKALAMVTKTSGHYGMKLGHCYVLKERPDHEWCLSLSGEEISSH